MSDAKKIAQLEDEAAESETLIVRLERELASAKLQLSAAEERAAKAEAALANIQWSYGGVCRVCRGCPITGHGASCDIGRALAPKEQR